MLNEIVREEPPSKSQELNIAEIFYVYFNQSSGNRDHFQNSLTTIIESNETELNKPPANQKLTLLSEALKNIKQHDLSFESTNPGTSTAVKDSINNTLQCYKQYFLTKFSDDGDHKNCDKDVQNILSNFNDTSSNPDDTTPNLLKSLTVLDSDKQALEKLAQVLNNYLAGLVIKTESKINNNARLEDQKDNVDKIKNILAVFPGGVNSFGMNQVQFACIGGSIQRVEEAISLLNDSLPEVKSMQSAIDIFSAQIASKVEEGSQVHIKPCAWGALMLDTSKVAKKDVHYALPQKDITLRRMLEFCYNLADQVKKEIEDPIKHLIKDYQFLTKEEPIDFSKINTFTKRAKGLGFNIKIDDILAQDANGNKYEYNLDDGSVEKKSHLLSLGELKEKYSTIIPSEKFKKELLKIERPEFDYLKHLLDPKKLFKDSSESGDEPSNRLDVKKIKNLVDLFPAKGYSQLSEEAKNAQKSKMLAGLNILRNILDDYKTNDNNYFYFRKFDKKFKEKTGESFEDFFYTKENSLNRFSNFFGKKNEPRKIKDEFIQEKPILDTIMSRIKYKEQSLYKNLDKTHSAILNKQVLKKLFSIEELVTEEEKLKKIKKLLTPTTLFSSTRVLPHDILNVKNGSGENLAEILYQFSEEIFEIALDSEPKFLDKIMERGSQNTSLLQKIALKNDKELLLKIFKKYQETHKNVGDITGSSALSDIIFQHNLLYYSALENNADLLKAITPMLDSKKKLILAKTYFSKRETILIQACEKGYTASVQALIDAKADLNQGDKDGVTPLFIACKNGNIEIIKALIAGGSDGNKADVNKARTTDGTTPLHVACDSGNIEIVKALIAGGSDVNKARRTDGATPLHFACKKSGNIEIFQALIVAGAKLDQVKKDGATPLHVACDSGNIEILQALIEGGSDVNKALTKDGATPLHVACESGNIEIVQALIDKEADVNKVKKDGATPLYLACQNPKGEASTYLGQTRKINIVKALIKRGADVNIAPATDEVSDGVTPLFMACLHGQLESVQDLIDAKANLNIARTSDGATPLHLACSKGFADIFKALIEGRADGEKADLKAYANNNKTTLHFACTSGNIEIIQALIKGDLDGNKADVNACASDGVTPLYLACQIGYLPVVEELIKARANLDLSTINREAPIYTACKNNFTEVAKALFKAGANVDCLRRDGVVYGYLCKKNLENVSEEMKTLIKGFINPEKIKSRDKKLRNESNDGVNIGIVFAGQEARRTGGGRSYR